MSKYKIGMSLERKDLKILALQERIAELEDKNADYRVDITILSRELEEVKAAATELKEDPVDVVQEEIHTITSLG